MTAQLPQTKCMGCDQPGLELIEGEILPRFTPGVPAKAFFCVGCWEIVDGADPETGAFGAGCCDVRRSSAPMGGRMVMQPPTTFPLCSKPFAYRKPEPLPPDYGGWTVRELISALEALPQEYLDLKVRYMDEVWLHDVTQAKHSVDNEFGVGQDYPHIRLS